MLDALSWLVLSLERAPRVEMERRRADFLSGELCLELRRGGCGAGIGANDAMSATE